METPSLQFEHLIRLLQPILSAASVKDPAPPGLLEILARWFNCQWATYWRVDSNNLVLRAVETWSGKTVATESLLEDTKSRALTLSEGTAGHVWRTGRPICTSNLIQDMCLPRSLDASAAGLSGGIWFPIRAENITHGVIELLGKHYWTADERLVEQLFLLGESIGNTLSEQKKL